ncbi:hypothetical protein PF008_g26985 [Phytophthora fragariae]|uniref:Uncharacterized protein n=1 Tax=Phytophthora fragariae TaxID=53985 RepID=A0A6G0QFL6_9STRA|nr:hypothetical protein PF008_g26985 [Phytophthora fragariae]
MTNFWWNISIKVATLGACCLAVNSACLYTFNTLFYIKTKLWTCHTDLFRSSKPEEVIYYIIR